MVFFAVRRQGFWNQWLFKLSESLAHLVGLTMRHAVGDASAVLLDVFNMRVSHRAVAVDRIAGRRRISTRYDRCPKVFLSAIALAATVIFWL